MASMDGSKNRERGDPTDAVAALPTGGLVDWAAVAIRWVT